MFASIERPSAHLTSAEPARGLVETARGSEPNGYIEDGAQTPGPRHPPSPAADRIGTTRWEITSPRVHCAVLSPIGNQSRQAEDSMIAADGGLNQLQLVGDKTKGQSGGWIRSTARAAEAVVPEGGGTPVPLCPGPVVFHAPIHPHPDDRVVGPGLNFTQRANRCQRHAVPPGERMGIFLNLALEGMRKGHGPNLSFLRCALGNGRKGSISEWPPCPTPRPDAPTSSSMSTGCS